MHDLHAPLNDWKIVPDHDDKGHWYLVDGDRCPSVTTVLKILDKPLLIPWATKMMGQKAVELFAKRCNPDATVGPLMFSEVQGIVEDAKKHWRETKEDAADTGTIGHKLIENYLVTGNVQLEAGTPPGVIEGFNAFSEWQQNVALRPIRVESYVASKAIGVAGTVDCIGYVNGKLCVVDFKFASGIYPEYKLQVAAYVKMVEEMVGKTLDGAMIARFDKKTGTFNPRKDATFIPRTDIDKLTAAFGGLVTYFKNV